MQYFGVADLNKKLHDRKRAFNIIGQNPSLRRQFDLIPVRNSCFYPLPLFDFVAMETKEHQEKITSHPIFVCLLLLRCYAIT